MSEEVWKTIPEFPNYKASNLGRVKSIDRLDTIGRPRKGKILSPSFDQKKYHQVVVYKDGKPYTRKVHRLIALAFIPNPENKPEVNHKNLDSLDNSVGNLEWCTASENQKHVYANGARCIKGDNHPRKKVTSKDVLKIRNELKNKYKNSEIAKMYNISPTTVGDIISRKTWKHIK